MSLDNLDSLGGIWHLSGSTYSVPCSQMQELMGPLVSFWEAVIAKGEQEGEQKLGLLADWTHLGVLKTTKPHLKQPLSSLHFSLAWGKGILELGTFFLSPHIILWYFQCWNGCCQVLWPQCSTLTSSLTPLALVHSTSLNSASSDNIHGLRQGLSWYRVS